MQSSFLTTKAQTRRTARGAGAFASETIYSGETVAAFGGWVATASQVFSLPNEKRRLALQIDDELYLVSPTLSRGDCINHSCEPNCGLLSGVLLVALHDIPCGAEITYDYAMSDGSPYDEFACECGTAACRGRVTGDDWRDPRLQARYTGHFSPYLTRRIAALSPTSVVAV